MLYTCFYCGCIATDWDHVPPLSRVHDYRAVYDRHPPIMVPACSQCNSILGATMQEDIYARFQFLKKRLTSKLGYYIAMGELWTEEDVEYGEFTGSLKVSMEAIPSMAKNCKDRIDFKHWPVTVDGNIIEKRDDLLSFKINGKTFTSLDFVFEHARKVDRIAPKYLQSIIDLVGLKRIEYAYNICRANPIKSENMMKKVLKDVQQNLDEES